MIRKKFADYPRLVLQQATRNAIRSQLKRYGCSNNVSKVLFHEDFIKSQTVISNDHLTPELSLRLVTPECEMWHCDPKERFQFENDPFWAIYWPGGQALARFILDNTDVFKGKNVIDIGSGSGACAIAAAKSGANIVLANDIDEVSLKAVRLNSHLNEVKIFTEKKNLIGKNVDSLDIVSCNIILRPKWDIVLVGDMFYDSDFSVDLFTWLSNLNSCGKTILIGDPGRHAMKDIVRNYNLVKLADYPIKNDEHFGFSSYSVWKVH